MVCEGARLQACRETVSCNCHSEPAPASPPRRASEGEARNLGVDSTISADGNGREKETKIPRSRSVRKLTSRFARDDNSIGSIAARLKPCPFTCSHEAAAISLPGWGITSSNDGKKIRPSRNFGTARGESSSGGGKLYRDCVPLSAGPLEAVWLSIMLVMRWISTRRFLARPVLLPLVAAGLSLPKPIT